MSCFNIVIVFVVIICNGRADGITQLKCGPNEIQDDCPSECELDACPTSEHYSRRCERPPVCPAPACKCAFNYKRAADGTCVHVRSCPAFRCGGAHEVYEPCPALCPSDACGGECPPYGLVLFTLPCQPSCRCEPGFRRHHGACVPRDACPQ